MYENLSEKIKIEAKNLGFSACGITKPAFLENEKIFLENWLQKKMNAEMFYMENHFEKRINPSLLVENVKSIIVVLWNYFIENQQLNAEIPKISKYAIFPDYHIFLKKKLSLLAEKIEKLTEKNISYRCFVDSAPILERSLALRSGLGFIGKNTNFIAKNLGSYVFIAEIFIDLPLDFDSEIENKNVCGKCLRCVNICPTKAILEPYVLDANRCLAYWTIEAKSPIPQEISTILKRENILFGCDLCQEVCPYNSKLSQQKHSEFSPNFFLFEMEKQEWKNLSQESFNKIFKNSPIKRATFQKIQEILQILT